MTRNAFTTAGFEVIATGGSCTAWFKAPYRSSVPHILVTGLDGCSHELSGSDDAYIIGVHWEDVDGNMAWSECLDAKSDADAVEAAKVVELALRFSRILLDEIGADNLLTVAAHDVHLPFCLSHDFCDANMVMVEAWRAAFGKPAWIDGASEMPDADLERWNRAWTYARECKFFTESAA